MWGAGRLRGAIDGGANEVTVAFWALVTRGDGSPIARVTHGPIGVIKRGIAKRDDPDGPRYLVYASAVVEGHPRYIPGAFEFHTHGGVAQVMDDGSIRQDADRPFRGGHGFDVEDARGAARAAGQLCVKPPLPSGTRETWRNLTGLTLNMDEYLWADRLDRVCKTALSGDIDSPVWDLAVALALAEEFADADGLRPDLSPESRQRYIQDAAHALWFMIVNSAIDAKRSVSWDRVPRSFSRRAPGSAPMSVCHWDTTRT